MSATVHQDDARALWLTLDEVVAKLRFPSRRGLLMHLRRHPVKVYQRGGSRRYFMKADDVDRMMEPVDLRLAETAPVARDDAAGEYVEVAAPTAKPNGTRARPPRATPKKPPTPRRRG